VVVFADFTFLYATQASDVVFGLPSPDPVIAVGVSPATAVLPPPVPLMCP
jgi:hypothetical protein